MVTCKNCGNEFEGNYCNHCGQKSNVQRIDLFSFIRDTTESIFRVDIGLFHTIKELFFRPGKTINSYLEGKRRPHFKPIAYILTLSTIYFIVSQLLDRNTLLGDLTTGWMLGATELDSEAKIPYSIEWLINNYAYTILILLPIFSFASFLSFKKYGKNYLEHIVLNSYITGQQAFIYSLFAIIQILIKKDIIEPISLFTGIFYVFWVFAQVYENKNKFIVILRTLVAFIIYIIISLLIFTSLLTISSETPI